VEAERDAACGDWSTRPADSSSLLSYPALGGRNCGEHAAVHFICMFQILTSAGPGHSLCARSSIPLLQAYLNHRCACQGARAAEPPKSTTNHLFDTWEPTLIYLLLDSSERKLNFLKNIKMSVDHPLTSPRMLDNDDEDTLGPLPVRQDICLRNVAICDCSNDYI
jgi:hypothetical protein